MSLAYQIEELKQLVFSLKQASSQIEKLEILNDLPVVQAYLSRPSSLKTFLAGLTPDCDYVIKSIIAIGQGPIVFNGQEAQEDKFERLRLLIQQLMDVEQFYRPLGGIIGYHLTTLTLLSSKEANSPADLSCSTYIQPEGPHLDQDKLDIREAIQWGIQEFEQIAEIYPVGGAGDRLNLIDDLTGSALPAALLHFIGRSLLEGLIRDVQAREHLYFKLYGKQILTPIAMMTSREKNNHQHILAIFKKKNWFGRPPNSFFFFVQPLVPVLTKEGNWSLSSYLTLTLKPGGHGVIWKLAQDTGVFDWLKSWNRHKTLIRQINNPLAGIDSTLLALSGIGLKNNKKFGFASCERLINSDEGTNVLIETQSSEGFSYCLTNIEYTDFEQRGMEETPGQPDSPYSIYPANTNILFADIPAIEETLKKCVIPGPLINMKSKTPYLDANGHLSYVQGGRLESTMQNIADYLIDTCPDRLNKADQFHKLQTFIIYNQRIKTISTTKKSYQPGQSPISTPEYAYYELLCNHLNLLRRCQFDVPLLNSLDDYLSSGPAAIFLYHPGLGPLYSIIAQKLRGGCLAPGAELQLEIAEVDMEELSIQGSAIIESVSPLGHYDSTEGFRYGKESRCLLHRVKIVNKGINRAAANSFWKNAIFHTESFYVLLHEGSEFQAQDVLFEGDFFFEVPAYHRLVIEQSGDGQLIKRLEKIREPSWQWDYRFDADRRLQLTKIVSSCYAE